MSGCSCSARATHTHPSRGQKAKFPYIWTCKRTLGVKGRAERRRRRREQQPESLSQSTHGAAGVGSCSVCSFLFPFLSVHLPSLLKHICRPKEVLQERRLPSFTAEGKESSKKEKTHFDPIQRSLNLLPSSSIHCPDREHANTSSVSSRRRSKS